MGYLVIIQQRQKRIVARLYSVIRHNVFPAHFSQQAMMGDVLFVDVFRQKR
ncbi:Uncharacterised protein [Salmonella enterica subsp. enterica serovar Bovismorbificans]|uniref:Uncharacterized protein n=1 Tax=Salmonella enterica subsp. enterica serovar Bovismorbificans TaxID=58097 RepID=A0A655BV03_SALET|nr:Uncharacterised protein [Salmonella enterica subsp. enterica serovar Bovismorbificans]